MDLLSIFKKTTKTVSNKSFSNYEMTGTVLGNFNEGEYVTEMDKIATFNTYLASAIRAITKNIIQPTLREWDNNKKLDVNSPMFSLYKTPNTLQDYTTFIQYIVFSYLYDGNAYILKVKDTKGNITGLLPLPFSNVEPFIEFGVIKYRYTNNKTTSVYTKNDIIQWKDTTYGSSYLKGTGVVKHAVVAITLNSYADRYNITALKTGEIRGILSTEANLTEEDVDLYLSSWNKRYSGVDNKNSTAVLGGGLTWTPTGTSLKDMGFAGLKEVTRNEIFSLMGTPPVILGYANESNYANSQVQERLFWTNTIMPMLSSLDGTMTRDLGLTITEFYHDYSNINALSSNLTELLTQGKLALDMGYSLESITTNLEIPFEIAKTITPTVTPPEPIKVVEVPKALSKTMNNIVWNNFIQGEFIKSHRTTEKRMGNELEKHFVNIMKECLTILKNGGTREDVSKCIRDEKNNIHLTEIVKDNIQKINDSVINKHLFNFNLYFIAFKDIEDKHLRGLVTLNNTLAEHIERPDSVVDLAFKNARDLSSQIVKTFITAYTNDCLLRVYKDKGLNEIEWLRIDDCMEHSENINSENVPIQNCRCVVIPK